MLGGMARVAVAVMLMAMYSMAHPQDEKAASISSLPDSIRTALLALCESCRFADYDAPWNPTDVIDGNPRRRLTRIVDRGSSWLIQYDHGGIATHSHTVIFDMEPRIHVGEGSDCVPSRENECEW
jgi:hypothetical protein